MNSQLFNVSLMTFFKIARRDNDSPAANVMETACLFIARLTSAVVHDILLIKLALPMAGACYASRNKSSRMSGALGCTVLPH
jgi:hypothetical protein